MLKLRLYVVDAEQLLHLEISDCDDVSKIFLQKTAIMLTFPFRQQCGAEAVRSHTVRLVGTQCGIHVLDAPVHPVRGVAAGDERTRSSGIGLRVAVCVRTGLRG